MIYNTGMQVGYWLILAGKWLFNRCYLAKKRSIRIRQSKEWLKREKRHAEDYQHWKAES